MRLEDAEEEDSIQTARSFAREFILVTAFEPARVKWPRPMHVGRIWPVTLTVSVFNRLRQYASSPGNRAYCYAEGAVFFPSAGRAIASTLIAYPRRDGQAELACVADQILRRFAVFSPKHIS